MNTSSENVNPEKKTTDLAGQTKTVLPFWGNEDILFTMKSLILAQDER